MNIRYLTKITPFNTRIFEQNPTNGLENAQNGKICHSQTLFFLVFAFIKVYASVV